jgi:Ca2+/Na+ antiporter
VQDALQLLVLSLVAMFNPTLLAAVTVMLLLEHPQKLMLGYLCGALLTSIAVGLVVVFSLHETGSAEAAKRTLSPLQDLVFGALLVIAALVMRSGKIEERRARKKAAKAEKPKKESLPERLLGRGSARVTFFVGVILSFPGASYLAALDKTAKLGLPAAGSVAIVIAFCLVQQLLLETPIVGYALAPERTQRGVEAFRGWLEQRGRQAAARVVLVIGVLLLIRGAVELIVG